MLAEYLSLKDQLEYVRWKHAGKNSEEEEALLDKMDELWLKLSEEERREVKGVAMKTRAKRVQLAVACLRYRTFEPDSECYVSLHTVSGGTMREATEKAEELGRRLGYLLCVSQLLTDKLGRHRFQFSYGRFIDHVEVEGDDK